LLLKKKQTAGGLPAAEKLTLKRWQLQTQVPGWKYHPYHASLNRKLLTFTATNLTACPCPSNKKIAFMTGATVLKYDTGLKVCMECSVKICHESAFGAIHV